MRARPAAKAGIERSGTGDARRTWFRVLLAALLAGVTLGSSGCTNFFTCDKTSCTDSSSSTSTSSTTTDYAYVGFTSSSASTIVAYNVGSGALTSLGTITPSYVPLAMVVAESNDYLYVASVPGATTPGIYGYTISSTGTLTVMNSGSPLISEQVAAIAMSPDGDYLYALDATDGITEAVYQYSVNTSTGALTADGSVAVTQTSCGIVTTAPAVKPCDLSVSPNGAYLSVSLAANGQYIYPYSSTSGLSGTGAISFTSGSSSLYDYTAAWDDNDYLYIGRSTQLADYAVSSSAATEEAYASYTSGGPRAVALTTSYSYVYTANPATSAIYGYGIGTSGALTTVSGSPFTGPTDVAALGFEKSGAYAVAVGYSTSSGVELFSYASSTGILTEVTSAATTATTSYPVSLALTH